PARHHQDGIHPGILRPHPSAIAHRPCRQHREGGPDGDRERSGTEELAFDPYRPVAPPAFEDLRGIEDAYGIEDLLEIHREEEDRIRGEAMTEVPATFFARAGLEEKRARLEEILRGLGRVLIAYSGGVDSAVLLAESHRVLGDLACGVIAQSPSLPEAELKDALSLAREGGFPARVIRTEEMDREEYRANRPDRCFHCKTELFEKLEALAREESWD